MSQAWKLVEAEPLEAPKPANDANPKQDNWNKNRRGQSGGRGGRRQFTNKRDGNSKGRRYYDDPYYGGIYIPDTPESRTYYARVAVYNIEMLFTIENLCRDTFLRSYMDEAGYIPIMFICNYISSFGANYSDILNILQESTTLEIDLNNETLRLKENWQMWLMPNGEGGMGLPLYLKQPVPPVPDQAGAGEYFYDYQTGVYYSANQWYGGAENGQGNYDYCGEQYVDANGQLLPIEMPPGECDGEGEDFDNREECEHGSNAQGLHDVSNDVGEVEGDADADSTVEFAKKQAMGVTSGSDDPVSAAVAVATVDN